MKDTPGHATQASMVGLIRRLSKPLRPRPAGVRPRLLKLEDIRAVLFDVYGTLFISGSGDVGTDAPAGRASAFAAALRAGGFTGVTPAVHRRGPILLRDAILRAHNTSRARGIRHPEVRIDRLWTRMLRSLVAKRQLRGRVTRAAISRTAVTYECLINPTWPMPAAADVLKALGARKLKLGLVSNAQFFTPLLFDALLRRSPRELGFVSRLCIWSFQHGQGKPSPRLLSIALQRLKRHHGVQPRQVVYIGNDMLKDIQPAVELGCRTVLFAGDRRSLRLHKDTAAGQLRPDAIITRLDQLLRILGGS